MSLQRKSNCDRINQGLTMSQRSLDIIAIVFSSLCVSIVTGLAFSIAAYGAINYALITITIFIFIATLIPQIIRKIEFRENSVVCNDKYAPYVMLCALLIGAFLFGRQFEYASIWGDVGVYVNAASHFKHGGSLPFAMSAVGWDIDLDTAWLPPRGMINPSTDGLWQFHGLPVWPGLMAISSLAGDGREVLSVLFGINIFLFYVIGKYFVKDAKSVAIAAVILAALPLSWHQALYATAEMLLLSIFLSGVVFLFALRKPAFYVGAAIFAFGVVHSGIIILSPIFGLVLFISGVFAPTDRKKTFALIGLWSGIAALAAIKFAAFSSEIYMKDIVSALFGSFSYLAYVACLLPIIAALPWAYNISKARVSTELWLNLDESNLSFNLMAAVFLVLMGGTVIILGYLIGWTEYFVPSSLSKLNSWSARTAYVNHGIHSLLHLSIVNIGFASGFLGLLGFVSAPWLKGFDIRLKLLWLFVCAFVVIFGLYRADITNNYYSSRYFYPIIVPCLLIFAAFLMEQVSKWRVAVIPVLLICIFYNGAMLGEGFFSGERMVTQFLREQITQGDRVAIGGSDWLKYRVYPRLLETEATKSNEGERGETYSGKNNFWNLLVSDSDNILGVAHTCYGYVERRIPWQIGYLIAAEFIKRNICIYRPNEDSLLSGSLSLGTNQWLPNGNFQFLIVTPSYSEKKIEIEVHSFGWWAKNKIFREKMENIKPELVVCGDKFELKSLSAETVVFIGKMQNRVCKADLRTPVFVPSEIGENHDNRQLGIDMYGISMH